MGALVEALIPSKPQKFRREAEELKRWLNALSADVHERLVELKQLRLNSVHDKLYQRQHAEAVDGDVDGGSRLHQLG